jgi:hypothetical protein
VILVDSSAWIDYFNGTETLATKKLDSLLGVKPVCTGDLILAEVLQGFRLDPDYQAAKKLALLSACPRHVGRNSKFKKRRKFQKLA